MAQTGLVFCGHPHLKSGQQVRSSISHVVTEVTGRFKDFLLLSCNLLMLWPVSGVIWTHAKLPRRFSWFRMVLLFVKLPGDLVCRPVPYQGCGPDSERQDSTQGDLDKVVEDSPPLARTAICVSELDDTGGALPETYRRTCVGPRVCVYLTKQYETDFMRQDWEPDVHFVLFHWLQRTVQLAYSSHRTIGIGSFVTGDQFCLQMRAGTHWAHATDETGPGGELESATSLTTL